VSVLWDTSIVIDLLGGHEPALVYARGLSEPPSCSEITRVEVLRGVRGDERRATERLFGSISWIDVGEAIARRAGELGRTWRRSHPGIATADLIIAATADELGLELATLNMKHFPMRRGLRPPYTPSRA
jgi:predicted nucleic acid-binding protein